MRPLDHDSPDVSQRAPTHSGRGPAVRLLRDPLLHFLAAGGILFALYAYLERQAQPVIVITESELRRMSMLWEAQWRRAPSPAELEDLINLRIREEILFRESVAAGLDQNDAVVRRRLAQKLETSIADMKAVAQPTDEELAAYFSSHRERYRKLAEVSFEHRYFSAELRGDSAYADAVEAKRMLESGGEIEEDPFHESQQISSPVQRLGLRFGQVFEDDLQVLLEEPPAVGTVLGPVLSAYGYHLVELLAYQPARQLDLVDVRVSVLGHWRRDHLASVKEDHYLKVRQGYRVEVQDGRPIPGKP